MTESHVKQLHNWHSYKIFLLGTRRRFHSSAYRNCGLAKMSEAWLTFSKYSHNIRKEENLSEPKLEDSSQHQLETGCSRFALTSHFSYHWRFQKSCKDFFPQLASLTPSFPITKSCFFQVKPQMPVLPCLSHFWQREIALSLWYCIKP